MSPHDPEAAYYQSVEEYFVSRRGDPLFLSNSDWLLIRSWKESGIPLRVVLRGIGDALDGHAHSWGRQRKVASLAYCAGEVETARERWQRAVTLGDAELPRPGDYLRSLALALEDAELAPQSRQLALDLAAQLRVRAEQGGSLGELEPWLIAREAELAAALRRDLGRGGAASIEAEVDQDLRPYQERMPPRVVAQIRTESITRRLLQQFGLPRLSLVNLA